MAKKHITAVRLAGGQVERVRWIEDGNVFTHEDPADKVARAINSGEPFYVRADDATEIAVRTRFQHGRQFLVAQPDPTRPDRLLQLPTF